MSWTAAHHVRIFLFLQIPAIHNSICSTAAGVGGGGEHGGFWGLKRSEDKELEVSGHMSSKFIWLLTFPPVLFRAAPWLEELEQYNFIFKAEMEMKRTLHSASIVWLGFSFKEEKLNIWEPDFLPLFLYWGKGIRLDCIQNQRRQIWCQTMGTTGNNPRHLNMKILIASYVTLKTSVYKSNTWY